MPGSIKTKLLVHSLLHLMALSFRLRPAFRAYLKSKDGWMKFCVGFRTLDDAINLAIRFDKGKARVLKRIPDDVDTILNFRDESIIHKMLALTPEEVMDLVLKNELSLSGNLATMNKFNFLLSLLLRKKHRRLRRKQRSKQEQSSLAATDETDSKTAEKPDIHRVERLRAEAADGTTMLDDPYLSDFALSDFPRLKKFLEIHLMHKPAICHERASLLTDWFREHGFQNHPDGHPWIPELRQAKAFKNLMENREPIIRDNDLLAGTTTTKEIGVVLYPETHASMIWGELFSVPERRLNPYDISEDTRQCLHHDVFPYWERRNIREWVRKEEHEPLCQRLDERFAVYFLWKTVAISHTIADFPKLLALGTEGMSKEIHDEIKGTQESEPDKRYLLEAILLNLEGVEAYAANLSRQAAEESEKASDSVRRGELQEISEICSRVPRRPAESLHEALQAIWIFWVSLHMENTNAGLSLGRMDRWLQPFFEAEIQGIDDPRERRNYVERTIELVGCFFMRCTDHLPLVPDIGNFLFGGSSSDQAITLGGITPDGSDAVCDMTYIFLKVTEMLGIRDPNVNARYSPGINPESYLRRLCEVNLITSATPSMHNDVAVMQSLEEFNYPAEHLRDWAATGCVEPTLSGKHMGHTNCMMMNMVAALEMALNNGHHPLMDWTAGPQTGEIARSFPTFEDFFKAFVTQYRFLIDQACEYNNILGRAHGHLRPTPLLSSMIDGCIQKGLDATKGGARYNTSGAAIIGLADVTDSLMALKQLAFDEKEISLGQFKAALDDNYAASPELLTRILNRVPKFGSGDPQALAMAQRITSFTHDCFADHQNHRGGSYTSGFWSMSNHVAFGCLTGALPSGRLAFKPFTPGLTPQASASNNLLDPIRDVAVLPARNMNNNIAFNVKVVPSPGDSHATTVDNICSYVKTYFDLGGMQMQLNVVTSALLREAMAHPENYRNLLVRISGYNAYFVTLNQEMQLELIERAEYGV